jgi:hypothetical protein
LDSDSALDPLRRASVRKMQSLGLDSVPQEPREPKDIHERQRNLEIETVMRAVSVSKHLLSRSFLLLPPSPSPPPSFPRWTLNYFRHLSYFSLVVS